jgi:hypothetical protein
VQQVAEMDVLHARVECVAVQELELREVLHQLGMRFRQGGMDRLCSGVGFGTIPAPSLRA